MSNSGGGGGPKFSFKSALNAGASEFRPSWMPQDEPEAPAAVESVTKQMEQVTVQKKAPKAVKKETKPVPAAEPEAPSPAEIAAAAEDEAEVDMTGIKENVNILFMGHVDAGKSTIGGHILFLTGMVDKRTMEKYEQEAKELGRESWYLSWALDLNDEERNKVISSLNRVLLLNTDVGLLLLKKDDSL